MALLHKVTFVPADITIKVEHGTTLLQAARTANVLIEAPCDGRGTCGKCQVKVVGQVSPPADAEVNALGNLLATGIRLACQAKVYGSTQVEVFTNVNDTFVTLSDGQSDSAIFDPPVHIVSQKPSDEINHQPLFPDAYLGLLRQKALEHQKGINYQETVVKGRHLLDWRYQPDRPIYGIALDIGTTSVVAELFDMANGNSKGICSCLNPQTEFGGDVLTRISFASKQADGTQILQNRIVNGINNLIAQLTAEQQLDSRDIYEVVVAGNTTMQHLLLGVNPQSLARAPYRPVFVHQIEVSPIAVGLNISPRGVVTLLPSAAAFVGADIMAGLLAVSLHRCSKTTLFIDIGTNGEIAVCKDGLLLGTSSAAGPALEGMNISCGCRAQRGAIEAVSITGDGCVNVKVIGNELPTGICGSGLIDLIAELVRVGVITANGRFADSLRLPKNFANRLGSFGGQKSFLVSKEGHLYLTQKDIRQVQLAKGAIVAAIDMLLREIGISVGDVDEILVAGAFGFHLQPNSLIGIGLLPDACQHKIRFVGNTAKEGAKAVLLNQQASREIQEIGQSIRILELSLQPQFQEYFVKSLAFPDRTETNNKGMS